MTARLDILVGGGGMLGYAAKIGSRVGGGRPRQIKCTPILVDSSWHGERRPLLMVRACIIIEGYVNMMTDREEWLSRGLKVVSPLL